MEARKRLQLALGKIEARIKSLEARPDRAEIEALRAAREADLEEISKLRAEVENLIRKQSDG